MDNGTNATKPVNNETSIQDTNSTATNTENITIAPIANSENSVVSANLLEHETGVKFAVASIGVLIILALTLIGLRDDW